MKMMSLEGLLTARSTALFLAVFGLILLPRLSVGQNTIIGSIELYGLQHVAEPSVRQALQWAEGDAVPNSAEAEAIKHRLQTIPGVRQVRMNMVCCVAGKTALFVGIEEAGIEDKGGNLPHFRNAPRRAVRLTANIIQAGEDFYKALLEAVKQGDSKEDDSRGYALMHNPAARAVQERFLVFAARDLKRLKDVLAHSSDAEQRALSAQVLGYAANKQAVVNDLVAGMSDPDTDVRNNAMRALAVFAVFARNAPQNRLKIPFEPFVRLLNSLDWTDRNKAGFALLQLSEKRDPALLASMRDLALPSLKEMARWKKSGYGRVAFTLLGRIGGLSEEAIAAAWEHGDDAKVLSAVGELKH